MSAKHKFELYTKIVTEIVTITYRNNQQKQIVVEKGVEKVVQKHKKLAFF